MKFLYKYKQIFENVFNRFYYNLLEYVHCTVTDTSSPPNIIH